MSAIAKISVVCAVLCVGISGCMTTSRQHRESTATSAEPYATDNDRVVHTSVPTDESAQNASRDASATSADRTTPNESANRADQDTSADHGRAVRVSCPEPAGAKAGECFTRVLYPPQFNEQPVQEVVRPAYEKITYTDPVYEDVQEQVLVREAYTREVAVPALYDTFYEQVLEKPAGKVWKKGRGAQERVDPNTGEIYCLVDEPAVYRTVEKRELKRPAGTRTEQVPAEYTTQTVRKLVKAPQEVRTQVPAEYTTITKKTLASGDSCEYVQVLCQDNATQSKIHEVEQALQARGYQVDNDGLDDQDLADALRLFQERQGLPQTGLMTAKTLEALGVALEPVQQPAAANAGNDADTNTSASEPGTKQ
jgi:murein L,D-transpeptidase YcbB/YkuD